MAYVKIIYQNSPSTATPINAQNLNHMDDQIALNDQRLTELEGAHVSSFNGRTGAVAPTDGDYNIEQISPLNGAAVGQVPVVQNVGTAQEPVYKFGMQFVSGGGIFYGTCTGEEANQIKAVTVSNEQNFKLKAGLILAVKFDANNTYSATTENPVKLNVNNTGAKQIYGGNTATPTGTNTTYFGRLNYYNYYVYDGTYWVWAGSSADNNTTYTPQGLGFGYAICSTAAATTAKVATLSGYSLVTNGIVSVKFTNSVPANATLNINNKGAKNIYYQGAKIVAGVIKAGDIATFVYSGNYNLICIDRGSNMPEHYPANRVYLDGDTSKTVQDALKWKELLSTPLTTSASNYTLSESVAKYNELMLAGCWNGEANTVWVNVPVINGSVSLEHTILHLNNDSSGTSYDTIESISGNTINAYGASTSCWLRVYAR